MPRVRFRGVSEGSSKFSAPYLAYGKGPQTLNDTFLIFLVSQKDPTNQVPLTSHMVKVPQTG